MQLRFFASKFTILEWCRDATICVDYSKLEEDCKWDGLKGYYTNTKLTADETINQYNNLWRIERAFRIAKTDLRIRPIYHRVQRRIEAHICISLCAYKVYKELERQLKMKLPEFSTERAIEIANTISEVTFTTPYSLRKVTRLFVKHPEQEKLLNAFKN